MAESFPKGKKTPWSKKKLLVLSNFSFSQSVSKRLVLQASENKGMFGKEVKNLFCQMAYHRVDWIFGMQKIDQLINLCQTAWIVQTDLGPILFSNAFNSFLLQSVAHLFSRSN